MGKILPHPRRPALSAAPMRTAVAGRLSRHHRNMSQPDGGQWRALRDRRKPAGEEWAAAKARFTSRAVAAGVVLSHHRFGLFVDPGSAVTGLVEIPRVKEPWQPMDPRDYPAATGLLRLLALIW
jgi:hypothetical protein